VTKSSQKHILQQVYLYKSIGYLVTA